MLSNNVIALLLILLLQGCLFASSQLPASDTFELEKYKGNWRSLGYGYLLTIENDGLTLYDISSAGCVKKPVSSQELASTLTHFTQLNPSTIEISMIEGATTYTFKRLSTNASSKLPDNLLNLCHGVQNHSPVTVFNSFSTVMKEHYAFFGLYGVDWDDIVQKHRRQISDGMSDKALFKTLTSMLDGLNDAHLSLKVDLNGGLKTYSNGKSSFLRPALDKAFAAQSEYTNGRAFRLNWFKTYKKKIKNGLLSGQQNDDFDEQIIWGTVGDSGDIGYINILHMRGFSESGLVQDEMKAAKKAMEKIIGHLKKSRAIIVDVTANGGGEDEVGRVIAGYFTDRSVLAYSKQAQNSGVDPQFFQIRPAETNRYLGPVVLVTSDHTVSAAEIFTMSMLALQNVIHVGETTRGAMSDVLNKTLPNGWELGLSNETYRDAKGLLWEGKGLGPEKHMPIFAGNNIYTSHQLAIGRIVEMIQDEE